MVWKEYRPDGMLMYGNFLHTVTAIMPMYVMRAIGGSLYVTGALVLVYNVYKTIKAGQAIEDEYAEAPALVRISKSRLRGEGFHTWLERKPIQLTVLATIAILIGGVVQIIPTLVVESNIPTIASVKPYTPLEVEGRDLYIREGCVGCHSQMVRPFRSEVDRKSTRLNSSHVRISYAVFCLKKTNISPSSQRGRPATCWPTSGSSAACAAKIGTCQAAARAATIVLAGTDG